MIGEFNAWNPDTNPMQPGAAIRGSGRRSSPAWSVGMRPTSTASTSGDGDYRRIAKADPVAFATELRPADGVGRRRPRPRTQWNDAAWMAPRGDQRARGADLDLRGPSRVVDAGRRQPVAQLCRTRLEARRLCPRDGLHPRRVDAGRRASVRRELGLSGHRLLRPDEPVWHPRRTSWRSSMPSTSAGSA